MGSSIVRHNFDGGTGSMPGDSVDAREREMLIRALLPRLAELDAQVAAIDEERSWIRAKLATLGYATGDTTHDADPATQKSDDDLTPETDLWGWAYLQMPQAPANGWEPVRLTQVIKKVRPDIDGKRVRNQIDRWRSKGKLERVADLWRRPATPPQPTEEGADM